jgi:hypothetical protein
MTKEETCASAAVPKPTIAVAMAVADKADLNGLNFLWADIFLASLKR